MAHHNTSPQQVLEQAPELGEIGAGIQPSPNAFAAFDALGMGEQARGRAVYTDEMVMHDALDARLAGPIFHVERVVRSDLWQGRSSERFYDAMEWLYGWTAENCLAA